MSKKEQILQLLKSKEFVTQQELNSISYRYGGRICELRAEGHTIHTEQIKKGQFIYKYLARIDIKPSDNIYETARKIQEDKEINYQLTI